MYDNYGLITILNFCRLYIAWVISQASGGAVCDSNYSLFPMTDMQTQLCKQYPELVAFLMNDAVKVFQNYCHHQFKHERWNCANITLPIFGAKQQPFLSLSELSVFGGYLTPIKPDNS